LEEVAELQVLMLVLVVLVEVLVFLLTLLVQELLTKVLMEGLIYHLVVMEAVVLQKLEVLMDKVKVEMVYHLQ
jgi:hypothetical protein